MGILTLNFILIFQSHIKNIHEKGPIVAYCDICNRGFHTKTKASQCRRQHIRSGNGKYQVWHSINIFNFQILGKFRIFS